MRNRNSIVRALLLAGGLLLLALPAGAQIQAGSAEFEVYGGWYIPASVDNDVTLGLRFGGNWTKSFNLQATIGYLDTTEEVAGVDVDFQMTFVDLSAGWNANPDSKAVCVLFAGPGWAWIDADSNSIAGNDNSFTMNVGVALKYQATDKLYVRPDIRGRWIDQSGDFDWEASIGLGWRF